MRVEDEQSLEVDIVEIWTILATAEVHPEVARTGWAALRAMQEVRDGVVTVQA